MALKNGVNSFKTIEKWLSRILKNFPCISCFLKIWYQSANRFQKNIDDSLHNTSLKKGIERCVRTYGTADFPAIVFELEEAVSAISKNLYMPLVLVNLLLHIQKHLRS
jgi:hypothetical protein